MPRHVKKATQAHASLAEVEQLAEAVSLQQKAHPPGVDFGIEILKLLI